MKGVLRKLCLGFIYCGTAIVLAAPLFVDNNYFFPFISTRVFIFRPVVEIMLLAYLLLNLIDDKFRPRFSATASAVWAFISIGLLSSLLGDNFFRSFWGDMERGDGIVLWLHLSVWLVILVSTVQNQIKIWRVFLDFSLVVAIFLGLFGLAQALKLPFVLITQGTRVDATFGNAAFFATYLLFHLAFAIYLFSERRNIFARIYYALAAALFIYLVFATQTRGAVIGLIAGFLFGSIWFALTNRQNLKIRKISIASIGLVILLGAAVFTFKDSAFVRDSPSLQRITKISLSARTAETRLATWGAAWAGWKERFFLGWGMENFQEVFNKHFPPIIYEDAGSQVWFDRAHNVIFDRAVATGIFGLVAFLLILFLPFYFFLRQVSLANENKIAAIIFASLLIAYFIQDLFIFESINIYLILFFTLAFWSGRYFHSKTFNLLASSKIWSVLFVIYAASFIPLFWKVNLTPARVNRAAAVALNSNPQTDDFFLIVERFQKVIETDTYGRPEYVLQFIEFVDGQLANLGEVRPGVRPVLDYADSLVDEQIIKSGADAKFYLLAMRHFNYTYASIPLAKVERIEKALSYLPKLIELTPNRPHIYQEAGYSHVYLYRFFTEQSETQKAKEHYQMAEEFFKKTISLQPKVLESYINLITLYLAGSEGDKLEILLGEMDSHGIDWAGEGTLAVFLNLAKGNKAYAAVVLFAKKQVELKPGSVAALIDLALAYAYLDDKPRAREIADRIKLFGGQYIDEANIFLKNLEANLYRDQRL